MRLKQLIKTKKGFSLTELLVAILILAMVSAVVAGGIPVAKDAYEKITLSANAQVMLSTAISALRNELCTAEDVNIDSATGKIEYYDSSIKNYSSISKQGSKGDVMLTKYSRNPKSDERTQRLVTLGEKLDDQLHLTYTSAEYSETDRSIIFKGLRVVGNTDGANPYAEMEDGNASELIIHLIAGNEKRTW